MQATETEKKSKVLVPTGNRIVVRRFESDDKTAGGIVIPDVAKEKPRRGRVVAVGRGRLLEDGTRGEMEIKPGDEVLFTAYAGSEIKIDGVPFLVMEEGDVLGTIE